MNQIILNAITSIIGVLLGTAVGLGIAYCASRIFGWDFKKTVTPRLVFAIVGTVVIYSIVQNLLKSYGISQQTLTLLNAALAFFSIAFITIFWRKKDTTKK